MDKRAYLKQCAKQAFVSELKKIAQYPDDENLDEAADVAADSIADSIMDQQSMYDYSATQPTVSLFPQQQPVPQFTTLPPFGFNFGNEDMEEVQI